MPQFGAFTPASLAVVDQTIADTALPVVGKRYYVQPTGSDNNDGSGFGASAAFRTIGWAARKVVAGDQVFLAAAEYDEDVTVSTHRVQLVGIGARNSVRVTGVAAGTSTGLLVSGAQDVGLYNLNLEGRSGGSGLKTQGQIRRLEVAGCKLHGGTQAVLLDSNNGGQIVDIRFDGCTIANAATGIFLDYNGGDSCHQIVIQGCYFSKITTDCIVENGATHDWGIYRNIFADSDGTEPTRFLDIDESGTTGLVADNTFATTVIASSKLAIAAGVLWVNNRTQAEQPGTNAFATSGRPD